MKKLRAPFYRIVLCLMLLFGAVMLAACMNPIPTVPAATPVALIASPAIASSPTPIPASPTSTVTRTPTSTQTRLPRPTSTSRPTNTPTPTAYPTLDAQGRLNFVLQAMKTNMGCELPCWWGITPGKMTWTDMVDAFVKRGIGLSEEGKLSLRASDEKSYEDLLSITFQKEGNLISGIDVFVADFHRLAQPDYRDLWQKYALDQILARDGIPTQVQLELTVGAPCWSPGMRTYYDLWLIYADQGLSVRYPGELIQDNQGWYVCPASNQFQSLEIRLRSPETSTASVSLTGKEDAPFRFSGTLQELADVSLPKFYEIFKQVPPAQCLLVSESEPWWYDEITLPTSSMILPAAQEEEYLVNNLASNADCELPCWWGIKPGETTAQSVQQMFLNLGKSVLQYKDYELGQSYQADLLGRHSPYPFDYVVQHRWFEGKNGIVNLLGVTGYSLNWLPPQNFIQDWHRYSLHEALTRYGPPSKVLLHYWNFGWQYSIGLVYEDKGFLIHYVGPISEQGKEFTKEPIVICPTKNRPTSISIWMTSPQNGYPIAQAFDEFGYSYPDSMDFNFTQPLEAITRMTIQNFYETFSDPNATVCLVVPRHKGDMAP